MREAWEFCEVCRVSKGIAEIPVKKYNILEK